MSYICKFCGGKVGDAAFCGCDESREAYVQIEPTISGALISSDFDIFKKEFTYWQYKLGLDDWEVYFEYKEIGDYFADVHWDTDNKSAVVRLNSKLREEDEQHKDVRRDAKHEAVHLLLAELQSLAVSRFIQEDQITPSIEGLVHRLTKLIS